jgi:hypothetical protein
LVWCSGLPIFNSTPKSGGLWSLAAHGQITYSCPSDSKLGISFALKRKKTGGSNPPPAPSVVQSSA